MEHTIKISLGENIQYEGKDRAVICKGLQNRDITKHIHKQISSQKPGQECWLLTEH